MLRWNVILLAALLGLAGCQGRPSAPAGSAGLDGAGSSAGSLGGSSSHEQGTSDSGGGSNGINHVPLEGYHVNMLTQDETQQKVLPLINALADVDLDFAARMYHILTVRSWMFVPVTMQQLSNARIGTYFPTDQFALQDTKEIWVDKNNFTAMTADSRLELIVHEIIMGIKIMQFTDANDHCKVKADAETLRPKDPKKTNAADGIRTDCDHQFKPLFSIGTDVLQVGTKLGDGDYARIRELTEKICEHRGAFDADEVQDWIDTSGIVPDQSQN